MSGKAISILIVSIHITLALGCSQFTAQAPDQAPVGFRGDGLGRYPDAAPPVKWSNERNVAWTAPMPSWSNATPVIVGDRIFVCSEPFDLICVSKESGEILWRKACDYQSLFSESEWAAVEKDLEIATPLAKQKRGLEKELKLKLKSKKADPAEVDGLKAKIEVLEKKLDRYGAWILPPTHKTNGYSSATPVSDGKHVFAVFGNGVVVSYDLQGERQWGRLLQKPFVYNTWGFSASPVLADGKLIVHLDNLVALDPASGEEIWRTEGDTGSSHGRYGTPAVGSIGGETILVLAGGQVVRASDGTLIGKAPDGAELKYASAAVANGIAYWMQYEGMAVRLPEKISDPIELSVLWDAKLRDEPKSNRYYGSPLIHGGLVYSLAHKNHLSA